MNHALAKSGSSSKITTTTKLTLFRVIVAFKMNRDTIRINLAHKRTDSAKIICEEIIGRNE